MDRGDVYLIPLELPDKYSPSGTTILDKYVVILRGGESVGTETNVPYVIASSDRRTPGYPLRRFEVAVGQGDGFMHATLVDCRWVYTRPKSDFESFEKKFKLSSDVMTRVSHALVFGLQMNP